MEQLSGEQNQTAIVEAQMGAFFANLNNKINENRLDEAAEIVQSTRNFLNTPAFQGLRAIQARKEMYTQTINTFETLIDEMRRNQAALASGVMPLDRSAEKTLADLKEENDQLKKANSEGAVLVKQVSDMKKTVEKLESDKKTLEASSAQKDNRIQSLERDTAALTQTVTARENTVAARERTISNRNDVLARIRGEIEGGKNVDDMSFNEIKESLAKIQNALQGLTP